jgi:DNA-binding NarL/FixJ family response regulator
MAYEKQELLAQHWRLTRAECEVVQLLARGLTNQEMGDLLYLDQRSIEGRIHRFAARSGLRSRALVAWANAHHDCCVLQRPAH